ncbi:MAG: TonB-dependent receptor [Bacteroides sp.]|nr:TonB-dependent receptor [Bacteroides sp.]
MKKMMMGALLLLMTSVSAFAQTKNIEVSGRVVEAETGEPAIQANVHMLSLPDSTYVDGAATTFDGTFTLPKAAAGKYALKFTYVGFKTKVLPLTLTADKTTRNIGTITLETDAVMLEEAVVTAEAAKVQVSEDTLLYNAAAYRTPQGAMLEELVRKLPGAEVDDSGNVKINGKQVSKLLVGGKEFFGGDVATGLQNLPVEMIDRIKTYDQQSDAARMTGIDDGEEETVLDLTVKKGMNQGWVMNFDIAGGTEDRYSGRGTVNYFNDNSQATIIANMNNTGSMGFGGGGARWMRNNGLRTDKMAGGSFAYENEKLEIGGSVRFNYNKNNSISTGYAENFLPNGTSSFSNSNRLNLSKNNNFNFNLRLEWRPDSLTTLLFRPNLRVGDSYSTSNSESGTFNNDPYDVIYNGLNPNNYLSLKEMVSDPFESIRVNLSNNGTLSDGKNLSGGASLQLNRRLSSNGRNIMLDLRTNFGDNENDSYSENLTKYFSTNTTSPLHRYNTSPSDNQSYSVRLQYSEPIAKQTYLQFSYQFQYSQNKSDRRAYAIYELDPDWTIGQPLPDGLLGDKDNNGVDDYLDAKASQYAEYKNYNHSAQVTLRFNRDDWQLSAGLNFQPQRSVMSYEKNGYAIDTARNVFNFSPNVDFRYRFSKQSQLRFQYRGRSSQPSMTNLLPITDDSNPLNITMGNPGLKPSFNHNISLFYNDYNVEHQRGITTNLSYSTTLNSISSIRRYNAETGAWTVQPENINGNWNASAMFGFNTALPNQKYTINTFSTAMYTNNVGYLTIGQADPQKNTTTNLMLMENIMGAYRNDWLEIGIQGSINYNIEKDKLNPINNQETTMFSYGGNVQVIAPWNMVISTNIVNQARRGYADESMNKDELVWNAQVAQTFLKGAATISLEFYDILKQQSNITRSMTASGRSVYQYNGINSYAMVHFTYRLNIFGSKAARDKMQNQFMMGGFGGGMMPPMGGGGGRGGRPMGGGGFGGGRR